MRNTWRVTTIFLKADDPITSVDQFVREVLILPVRGVEAFLRGASKHYDRTEPSVFRSQKRQNSEKKLFDELLASQPSSFAEDVSTLDKLVRMQHHGLPTRLLDITSNPLMALYFAAEHQPEDDGEVVRFEFRETDVKYPDSDRAAVMANLARLTPAQRSQLDTSLPKAEFNRLAAVRKLLHFIKQEKSYFEASIEPRHVDSIMVVRGKQSNPRIIAQSGAFLLFGNNVSFENSRKGQDLRTRKWRIAASAKKRILNELDQLNVNIRTVYPSLQSSAEYISARHS
jgi:hypothetical protein